MATNVSEKEARDVVEAAREADWKLPSFGKQLFLGDFRLDLIHPQPKLDPEQIEKGERFLAELREVLASEADPLEIEREAKIPDNVVDALKRIGALGIKVPPEYGGLGLSQVYYSKALAIAANCHSAICTLLSAHQSIGVAEPLRMFGSEEQRQKWLPLVAKDHISAFLLTEPGVGSDPARMASTATPVELGAGRRRHHRDAGRGRLPDQRPQAVGDQRNDRGHRRGDGEGAQERRSPRRDQRVRAAVRQRGDHGRAPQRVHGPARDRELRDGPGGRVRSRGEPDRPRGRRPADRAQHAEHGAAGADGDRGRGLEVGDQGRPRVVHRARAVGSPDRQARRGGAEAGVHRRQRVRSRGDARRRGPAGRRQAQRHPDRGRPVQGVRLGALRGR